MDGGARAKPARFIGAPTRPMIVFTRGNDGVDEPSWRTRGPAGSSTRAKPSSPTWSTTRTSCPAARTRDTGGCAPVRAAHG